jgi:competence protein ComEC
MTRCERGQAWVWDDVHFEVLHPTPDDYGKPLKPNALSCVLRVRSANGAVALLVADIEAAQEQQLLHTEESLAADWLLVPHHGSLTSSTPAFVQAVQPSVAVVQAGYRNRFGHPRPEVVARYDAQGVLMVQSARCGASIWRSDEPKLVQCERDQGKRYWHHVF